MQPPSEISSTGKRVNNRVCLLIFIRLYYLLKRLLLRSVFDSNNINRFQFRRNNSYLSGYIFTEKSYIISEGGLEVSVHIKKRIGDLLVEAGAITAGQLEEIVSEQKKTGAKFGETIVNLGILTEEDIVNTLAKQLGIEVIDLDEEDPDEETLKLVPETTARKHSLVPVKRDNGSITVAMSNPGNIPAIDELAARLKAEIRIGVSLESQIMSFISKRYGLTASINDALVSLNLTGTDEPATKASPLSSVTSLVAPSETLPPVARLLETIIKRAIDERASDIHLEPDEEVMHIRNRIDGVLFPEAEIPKKLQNPLISRVKVVSNMDIAETRMPQDGRFRLLHREREIEFRVSAFPTLNGENIVIRILSGETTVKSHGETGLAGTNMEKVEKVFGVPHGIVIVTGPTGSGKTTTLYTALNRLNTVERNIITIEDPVEYRLPGIRQTQINKKAGLDFSGSLRSILRQDPDIIMVGEIRDRETAEIATQAAMTGHMVLTTLHTNDAAGAVVRMLDLGVKPYLIASTLNAVIAQRLVRTICPKCKTRQKGNGKTSTGKYYGRGCLACNKSGYSGRTGIFEVLVMDDKIRKMIASNAPAGELKLYAVEKQGMTTMLEDGMSKVQSGITTIEEVVRVTADI
jgi:type IV pilus assembly protein PilB